MPKNPFKNADYERSQNNYIIWTGEEILDSRIKGAKSIDDYITFFPKSTQNILKEMRRTIKQVAPKAEEAISYQLPTFKMEGKNLVHFGAFKDHVAFFPTASARVVFKEELKKFKGGKGTIQFPLKEPIPFNLVRKIVRHRVKELAKSLSS